MSIKLDYLKSTQRFVGYANSSIEKKDISYQKCAKVQNNTLIDSNYNILLLNNPVSFKGGISKAAQASKDLSRNVSYFASHIDYNQLVLVGSDLKKLLALYRDRLDRFPTTYNKLNLIFNPLLEDSFALAKSGSFEGCEIYNISDKVLKMKDCKGVISDLEPNVGLSFGPGDTLILDKIKIAYTDGVNSLQAKNPKSIMGVNYEHILHHRIFEWNKNNLDTLEQQLGLSEKVEVAAQNLSIPVKKGKTFADIGGQDEAINAIKKEILYPVRFPFAYDDQPVNHGVILHGPHGTGKSLIGHAVANELGAYYKRINAQDLTTKFVGDTEEHWRNLFEELRAHSPSVLFIDEFDAIAKSRGSSGTANYDDKLCDQLLTLMSDLEKDNVPVFVIAATNKMSEIDGAIARGGRFGRHILVPNPTLIGYKEVIDIHTKSLPIATDFKLDEFASRIHRAGISPADTAEIIRLSRENAFTRVGLHKKMDEGTLTKEDMKALLITNEDFEEAFKLHLKEHGNSSEKVLLGFAAYQPPLINPSISQNQIAAHA